MGETLRTSTLRFFLLLVASYGLFFFSYKYYIPLARADFFRYYPMYQRPLDFSAATAPFVYRQISALVTHALYLTGLYYPEGISFSDSAIDQRMFFSALLANYLGLTLAATLAGSLVERVTGAFGASLMAGFLCLLSFHTQTAVITGLTEGISWFFVALLYLLYVRRARWPLIVVLAVSIFQREIIPLAFALIAFFSFVLRSGDKRYDGFVLVSSLLAFGAYLAMRAVIIAAPGYEYQLSLSNFVANLMSPSAVSIRDVVFQGVLSQNVVFIAAAAQFALYLRTRVWSRDFLMLTSALLALMVIGLGDGLGVNVGRIGGLMVPIFAVLAARALFEFDRSLVSSAKNPPEPRA